MKLHPGTTLHWALDNVEKALRLFNTDANDLLELIGRLRAFVAKPSAHLPDKREDLAKLEWELQRCLYHFASAAQTLVDMGRILKEALNPEATFEYDRLRSSVFDSEEHEFVIAARNRFSHAKLPDAHWNVTHRWVEDGHEVKTRVLVKTTDLVDVERWSKAAIKYAEEHEEVDVEVLANSYGTKVRDFNRRLLGYVESLQDSGLKDYRRCELLLKRIRTRLSYKLILQLTKPDRTDPYEHLDKFLTKEQRDQVFKLAKKSKKQVDLMIELADPIGAIDDEIRKKVYELFGCQDD